MTRDELRNAINHACDIMQREGLTTMDYMEQLSWLLFLKSFEETDAPLRRGSGQAAGLSTGNNLEAEATYNGRAYDRILAGDYRRSAWAGPSGLEAGVGDGGGDADDAVCAGAGHGGEAHAPEGQDVE